MAKYRDGTRKWTDIFPAKQRLCESLEKSDDAVLLVDIGGGSGHVLLDFVQDPAHRIGRRVVQDLPAALGDVGALKEHNIEAMVYDFFTPQPIKGTISSVQFETRLTF